MQDQRRAIIVRMKTRLQHLVEKFNTKEQAMFSISQKRQNFMRVNKKVAKSKVQMEQQVGSGGLDDYQNEDKRYHNMVESIHKNLSHLMKVKVIDREFLPSFMFGPDDVVVVIGQDGLVANTAKYVGARPIIAINPDPDRFDGVLLPFRIENYERGLLKLLSGGQYRSERVTMAEVKLNDGQRLLAFNDFFVGPRQHSSAKYQLTHSGITETQSSSGLIVSTGAGSTGWLSSLFNMATGLMRFAGPSGISGQALQLPWNTAQLVFAVREPFISRTSQANMVMGYIERDNELVVESLMSENGVIFSDGIMADNLQFNAGTIATIGLADEQAQLVLP